MLYPQKSGLMLYCGVAKGIVNTRPNSLFLLPIGREHDLYNLTSHNSSKGTLSLSYLTGPVCRRVA